MQTWLPGFYPSAEVHRSVGRGYGHKLVAAVAIALIALAPMLISACAEEAETEQFGLSEVTSRFGLIVVTHSEHRVPGGADPQVTAAGFFARHAGLSRDDVLGVLNLPDVPDSRMLVQEPGTCEVMVRRIGPVASAGEDAFVDFLDAGEIRLRLGRQAERLQRRSFPDIFPNVSGVTYDGVLPDNWRGVTDQLVTVDGRGAYEIGRFDVVTSHPPVPRLLEVSGAPVTSAYASVDWDADLPVVWLTEPSRGSDTIYLEVAVHQFDRTASVRCAVADSGSAAIPANGLAEIAPFVLDDTAVRLVVRRVARTPFKAPGLDAGELYFVSRDSVLLE